MADLERNATNALIDALQGTNCCGYDFFRIVRMIQAARSDLPLIGKSRDPKDDPIRFGQHPSLAFAPSTLDELVPGEPPKLYLNFFGLLGPNGPLPLHLTHRAIKRQLGQSGEETNQMRRSAASAAGTQTAEPKPPAGFKDHSFADFLDIFHHRMASFFFRAWAVSQPAVDLDRGDNQRFLFFLAAFFGESVMDLENPAFGENDPLPLRAKVYYAGRLACPTRNREGLEGIVGDYFGVPTTIHEFVGRWFNLPDDDRCRLGQPAGGKLGRTVIVGSKTWDAHLSFRLRLGPMGFQDYSRLLPQEPGFERLRSWVVNYSGVELIWEAQLVLRAAEVPQTQLGRAGKLGWTTWLKTLPFHRDADQLILHSSN